MAEIGSKLNKEKTSQMEACDNKNAILRDQVDKELLEIKQEVNQQQATAKAHREELQDKYNFKLAKIKDVCAQYFSKYEKHLLH